MATIKIRKGSGAPGATALSVSEPAFDYTNNALYIGVTGGGNKWIGAEVDNSTALGTSQLKIPTQYAVKTYVDNNVAAGAVASLNGLTGALSIGVSTGLSIASAGKGITLTNTGVQSAVAGSGISVSGATGAVTFTNTGVTGLVASTGISVSAATGNITLTNTGVQSFNGSTGAVSGVGSAVAGTGISVSGATGAVTFTNTGVRSFNGLTGAVTGVSSVNGSTGAVTNIAVTNGDNNFTASQTINAAGGLIAQNSPTTSASTTVLPERIAFVASGSAGLQYLYGDSSAGNKNVYLPAASGTLALTSQLMGTVNGSTAATTAVTSFNGLTGAVTGVASFNGLTGAVSGVTTTVANTFTAAQTFNAGITTTTVASTGNATIGGNVTITGDLTVNGTTTYINSTVTQVFDPIITIGGATGGAMPTTDDNKDRGIAFKYHTGSVGRTGFFGYDDSTGYFTFVPNAGITAEVVGGTPGVIQVAAVQGPATGTLSLGSFSDAVLISATSVNSQLQLQDVNTANTGTLVTTSLATASRTYTLPDHTGTVVVPSNLGTSGYILKANGTASQPTWIDANAAGFTAYAATTVNLTSDTTDTTCFLTFTATGVTGGQSLRFNSNLTYNAVTNYLEANIDGGSY
jgi:hypothetical protein